jgi:hypothetical protein
MLMKDQQMHYSYSRFYSLSYLLLHISASSIPSSGNLYVTTELLVPSESSLIKLCTMDGDEF